MPSNVKLLAGASGGEPTDANFKNVTLLLHGDGSNGAQNNTFIDSSTNNFTITRNGNTTQGSFSPYGSNWSNYFDGSGDYLTMPSNAAFEIGTGQFTLECWIYFNVVTNINEFLWADASSTTGGPLVMYYSGGSLQVVAAGGAGGTSASWTPVVGQWYHIAATRDASNNQRLFVNGVLLATATSTNNYTQNGFSIARSASLNGYMSNVRLVKGTALYTANFTPPTQPLTAVSGTSLLTCAYNRFRDGSTNNFTITRNGDVKVTNFAPFAPSSAYSTTTNGGSAYFDGSGDSIQAAYGSALDVTSGDFTIEGWVYFNSVSGTPTIITPFGTGSDYGGWVIALDSSARFTYYLSSSINSWNVASNILFSSTAAVPGNWYHFALVRSGSTFTPYLNGVAGTTTTSSATLYNHSRPIKVGAEKDANSFPLNGFVSNLRMVKGTAVYTAGFTPPSSPVTAITNTSLLLNATNAAIFDNSMKNDLETVGNAQISTSVKKFGTGSISGFNGSTSQVISYSGQTTGDFGAGDFTVELWVNTTAAAGPGLLTQSSGAGATNTSWGLFLGYASANSADIYLSNGSSYFASTGGGNINDGNWHHVAFSRSGSSGKLFVDGVQVGSTLSLGTTALGNGTKQINIGGQASSFLLSQGYIDDVRITKGVARYTANFTAPTAPFPNK